MRTPIRPPTKVPDRLKQSSKGFVPWDEAPSLADSMSWHLRRPGAQPRAAFVDTLPVDFLPEGAAATPFSEPVQGMAIREISDDELFANLFGKVDVK
ncbi:MAG: hypothetical protein V4532_19330 [Pseudomonadota bacterium]